MTDKRVDHNFFEQIKCQHSELAGLMESIRYTLATKQSNRVDVQQSIAQLCSLVESHFLSEEAGGYLHEVIDRAPQLEDQAKELHQQHEGLLKEVRALCDFALASETSELTRDELATRFNRFAQNLLVHEAHEDDLVHTSQIDES